MLATDSPLSPTDTATSSGHTKRSAKAIRFKAVALHVGISLVIFLGLLIALTQYWFPGFYFHIDGGWDGLQIILGCDIILGPCLTLILYKPGKKGLWFDMTVVALVQTAALSIGSWIVYQERPLAIAFADHAFFMVGNASFQYIQQPTPDLSAFPGAYPKPIFIDLPDDPAVRKDLRLRQGKDGPLHAEIARYRPYAEHVDKVLAWGGQHIEDVLLIRPESESEIDSWLQANGRTRENTMLIPITARSAWRYVYVDSETGDILDTTSSKLTPPF